MHPRRLLVRGRYRSERWGGFGNGVGDLSLDTRIIWIVKGCVQERLNTVEIEVVRNDGRIKAKKVAEDKLSAYLRTKQTGGRKRL